MVVFYQKSKKHTVSIPNDVFGECSMKNIFTKVLYVTVTTCLSIFLPTEVFSSSPTKITNASPKNDNSVICKIENGDIDLYFYGVMILNHEKISNIQKNLEKINTDLQESINLDLKAHNSCFFKKIAEWLPPKSLNNKKKSLDFEIQVVDNGSDINDIESKNGTITLHIVGNWHDENESNAAKNHKVNTSIPLIHLWIPLNIKKDGSYVEIDSNDNADIPEMIVVKAPFVENNTKCKCLVVMADTFYNYTEVNKYCFKYKRFGNFWLLGDGISPEHFRPLIKKLLKLALDFNLIDQELFQTKLEELNNAFKLDSFLRSLNQSIIEKKKQDLKNKNEQKKKENKEKGDNQDNSEIYEEKFDEKIEITKSIEQGMPTNEFCKGLLENIRDCNEVRPGYNTRIDFGDSQSHQVRFSGRPVDRISFGKVGAEFLRTKNPSIEMKQKSN